jgi:hypothetical protein
MLGSMKLTVEREITFDLDVPSERALDACRWALDNLGWEVDREEPGHLRAGQDLTTIGAATFPSTADLEIVAPDYDHTIIGIKVEAPGRGRKSETRAGLQLEALKRRILEAA